MVMAVAHQISPRGLAGKDWAGKLQRHDRKLTGPRQAILAVLGRARRPLTNKEILAQLRAGECDLATVYRSTHLLEELGVLRRFNFDAGAARYALISETNASHCHHLVCTRCSQVVEVGECMVRDLEERLARQSRFVGLTHRLEFFGICPACQ